VFRLVRVGDHKGLGRLLDAYNIDINGLRSLHPSHQSELENTLLHQAAWGRRVDCVRLLVSRGAKVDIKDDNGRTALEYAIRSEDLSMMQALLEAGADVHAKDKDGLTPLALAYKTHNADAVGLVLSYGAADSTPLHIAAMKGDQASLKHSISCLGSDASAGKAIRDALGLCPLHYAVIRGHLDCVKLLVDHAPDGSMRIDGLALSFALQGNQPHVLEFFIRHAIMPLEYQRCKKHLELLAARAEVLGHQACQAVIMQCSQAKDAEGLVDLSQASHWLQDDLGPVVKTLNCIGQRLADSASEQ
jgi:hypothetical protein